MEQLRQTNYSYNGVSRVKLCRVAITIDYHAISTTGLDVRKGSPSPQPLSMFLLKI